MVGCRNDKSSLSPDEFLDHILASAHRSLGRAINNRLSGQGGPPELLDPDLALTRVLASAHRQMGLATVARLTPETDAGLGNAESRARDVNGHAAEENKLFRHLPAVRIKYRRAALEAICKYSPDRIVRTTREAVACAQQLVLLLFDGEQCAEIRQTVEKLQCCLKEVVRLPVPISRRVSPVGADYIDVVRESLSEPASRLVQAAHGIQQLLNLELLSCLDAGDKVFQGAVEVAQDIVDDLAIVCVAADQLKRAAESIERASNDFCGSNLRSARLNSVPLDGVLWDLGTEWPQDWEDYIRASSVPTTHNYGVLVVEHSTTVCSDA